MAVGIYMDVHIPRSITNGLRLRGVDVLTAQEDGTITLTDPKLLDRATELGRILYSQDDDLLIEAHSRLQKNIEFSGVIYSHQLSSPIGRCVEDLEIIAKSLEPEDIANRIEFIPF
jgi:predicted nuclease of predicted toxin-antitoxin system